MAKNRDDMTRVTFTIPIAMVKYIDGMAARSGITTSRTSMMVSILNDAVQKDKRKRGEK